MDATTIATVAIILSLIAIGISVHNFFSKVSGGRKSKITEDTVIGPTGKEIAKLSKR